MLYHLFIYLGPDAVKEPLRVGVPLGGDSEHPAGGPQPELGMTKSSYWWQPAGGGRAKTDFVCFMLPKFQAQCVLISLIHWREGSDPVLG